MLEIRSLRKCFGALVAVDDVSFTVERGQLVGLLGPNGAGKTTTVSMIAGLGRPDRGDVRIDGRRLADRIVVIDEGRVIADDTLAGLQARVASAAGGRATLESVFLTLTGRGLRD